VLVLDLDGLVDQLTPAPQAARVRKRDLQDPTGTRLRVLARLLPLRWRMADWAARPLRMLPGWLLRERHRLPLPGPPGGFQLLQRRLQLSNALVQGRILRDHFFVARLRGVSSHGASILHHPSQLRPPDPL